MTFFGPPEASQDGDLLSTLRIPKPDARVLDACRDYFPVSAKRHSEEDKIVARPGP
jgi:hypothetical protein